MVLAFVAFTMCSPELAFADLDVQCASPALPANVGWRSLFAVWRVVAYTPQVALASRPAGVFPWRGMRAGLLVDSDMHLCVVFLSVESSPGCSSLPRLPPN